MWNVVLVSIFFVACQRDENPVKDSETVSDELFHNNMKLLTDIGVEEFFFEKAYQEKRLSEDLFNFYKGLDESMLFLYFDKVTHKRIEFYEYERESDDMEKNEMYLFEYNRLLAMNDASQEIFKMQYNQITFNQLVDLIDNYYHILGPKIEDRLSALEDKSLLNHWISILDENSILNEESPQVKSKGYCPGNWWLV